MSTGKIIKLTEDKYGFISCEEHEQNVFFHATSLVDLRYEDLCEGDMVEFEVKEGPKGLNAVDVVRVEREAQAA